MANYSYKAIDSQGKNVGGVIEAATLQSAEEAIALNGMIPVKVTKKKNEGIFGKFNKSAGKVKNKDLILFSKQFRSMFKAGIPLLRILEVIELQTENQAFKKTIAIIKKDINTGASLYDALKKHPTIFPPLYCNMINAGEVSGALPQVLDRLAYILEHESKVKANIRSALQYPIIVVIALVVAFIVLLTFVLPKFASIFAKAGLKLPLPTRVAMAMYAILVGQWYIMLIVAITIFFGLKFYLKTEKGKYVKDSFLLRLPVFGPLFIKAAMSRFASILSILMASGVSVLNAITVLSGTIGNSAIARVFNTIGDQIREGKGIAVPLTNSKFFTPMVVNMVAIGEESGNLDEMLGEITMHYDEEVAHAVSRLSDLIAPVLTVALAVVVGFFALAIYMPMWDLTKMVKQ